MGKRSLLQFLKSLDVICNTSLCVKLYGFKLVCAYNPDEGSLTTMLTEGEFSGFDHSRAWARKGEIKYVGAMRPVVTGTSLTITFVLTCENPVCSAHYGCWQLPVLQWREQPAECSGVQVLLISTNGSRNFLYLRIVTVSLCHCWLLLCWLTKYYIYI